MSAVSGAHGHRQGTADDLPPVEQLARALGAEGVPTAGPETAQSGPHVQGEAAPVAVISCCGAFVERTREWGYTPRAAPILDFSSLATTTVDSTMALTPVNSVESVMAAALAMAEALFKVVETSSSA